MKTLPSYLLLLLLTSCHSCQLFEDPKPKTELEKLPPATQEGKDTWGCLINSKAWYETRAAGHYQNGSLYVYGKQKILEPVLQGMSISLREDNLTAILSVGVYDLNPSSPYAPWVSYNISGCYYGDDRIDTKSGRLTITKFDKVNFIVSGLFEFTTVRTGCDTVKVTDGRFDMHYAP